MNIQIGIIGMGEHTLRAHLPYLLEKGVQISSFFDPSPQDLTEFGNKQPKQVSSVEEIYRDSSIDAILIGSPDKFHPEQLLQSVEAGKHVFVEKPLAIDSPGIETVKKALGIAKEKGLIISTCHPRRFDPPVIALKELIDGGDLGLGKILSFRFDFLYHKVTDDWKKDRSLLMDHFGHEIDLMRFLFNKRSEEVSLKAEKKYDSYACYLVEGNLDDISFRFEGKRTLGEKLYKESLGVYGKNGFLELNINDGLMFIQREGSDQIQEIQLPGKSYECMFGPVNNNFLKAMLGGEDPYVTHHDLLINNSSGVKLHEEGSFSY